MYTTLKKDVFSSEYLFSLGHSRMSCLFVRRLPSHLRNGSRPGCAGNTKRHLTVAGLWWIFLRQANPISVMRGSKTLLRDTYLPNPLARRGNESQRCWPSAGRTWYGMLTSCTISEKVATLAYQYIWWQMLRKRAQYARRQSG